MELYKEIIFEVTLVLIIGLLVMVTSFLEPIPRGFFCDDETIKYPYKPSTISKSFLCLFYLLLPNLLMCLKYYWTICKNINNLYVNIIYFWLGSGLTQITVNLGKYYTGRLRPHFIYVCKPNIDCTSQDQYISDYVCTNLELSVVNDSRASFPSGHASLAFYSTVYIILYLHSYKKNIAWVIIEFAIFASAWYTTLTRITDNMHHFTDVLAGSIIGTTFAILMMCEVKKRTTQAKIDSDD
ncbi:Phosphatidic acid phosphatase type 2/haloperoxidase [Cinara cedri]|uniref:Phosphatidic acid phosphatase type 2/haloperoxidase n=1 Tax=Cinara cedri TaxID=506608 RepID=A0A5E4NHT8_9HEMI|nr:Phosphatidic acid phosphatase type 2/haloperoxidase [Cinara cedri]